MDKKQYINTLLPILDMQVLREADIISINLSGHDIQLYKKSNLMKLAAELGQTVVTESRNCIVYPVISSFEYMGWKFFTVYQIGEE